MRWKRIVGFALLFLFAAAIVAGAYWTGRQSRFSEVVSAREQYAFQQQRLLQSWRALELLREGDTTQLEKESEADLFLSIDGMADVVHKLDTGSGEYLMLWRIIDRLEADLRKHPLKHRDTDELLERIKRLRAGRKEARNMPLAEGSSSRLDGYRKRVCVESPGGTGWASVFMSQRNFMPRTP